MFQYPKTFAELNIAKSDVNNPEFVLGNGQGKYAEALMYLVDQNTPEGTEEALKNQYLWHLAKFYRWKDFQGRPHLMAKVKFGQKNILIVIGAVFGNEYKRAEKFGYVLNYIDLDTKKWITKDEAQEIYLRQGILWYSKMEEGVKLSNILRNNYVALEKAFGKGSIYKEEEV